VPTERLEHGTGVIDYTLPFAALEVNRRCRRARQMH
jgi:hypothetical protein